MEPQDRAGSAVISVYPGEGDGFPELYNPARNCTTLLGTVGSCKVFGLLAGTSWCFSCSPFRIVQCGLLLLLIALQPWVRCELMIQQSNDV